MVRRLKRIEDMDFENQVVTRDEDGVVTITIPDKCPPAPAHNVTFKNATEIGDFRFVVEASTLDLPPGDFPFKLPTEIGNKQSFIRQGHLYCENQVTGFSYRQELGCLTLIVLND